MKVDHGIGSVLAEVPAQARAVEARGYDGILAPEITSDPFLALTLAAEHTTRVELMTAIAVAFARNPMTVALAAHQLNAFSQGRFILGLGSQIRPHITRRFSMPWSHPAARMREFVQALRAIWRSWYEGEPLDFRGEFYTHTLMTPMFVPDDGHAGAPRVFLAAVGPKMTEVAGEVADGMIAHGFTTARYLREVTLPALQRGLEKSGRTRADLELACPIFIVPLTDDELANARRKKEVRQRIAFYGSTPAYRPVLELHGWGEVQTELNRLSKRGEWEKMGDCIDDRILDAFAVVAPAEALTDEIIARYGDLVDRTTGAGEIEDPDLEAALLAKLHAAPAARLAGRA